MVLGGVVVEGKQHVAMAFKLIESAQTGGGPSAHPTSSRWSVPARYSRTASSTNDPTNQRVVISKSRDTLIHRS
jgi:hypothetical protein